MIKLRNTTLGEVVSEGGGSIRTGPFGSQLHASDYVEHGIPCIMPANMKDRRVNLEGIARISEEDANRLSKHLVKSGDIVYSRRGDVTQKALISPNEEGFFCGTGCLHIRPGNKIDSTFLAYYLSTPVNESWIVQQAVGATMPNLNTGILERVPLAIPHRLEDQKRIADVLSALDAKIELNNQINAELEAMAKLLYDYWFVQFDFPMTAAQAASLGRPALEGHPYKSSGGKMVHNPTLNRQIPEGWEAGTLDELFVLNPTISLKLGDTAAYLDMNALPTSGFMTKEVQRKPFNGGTKFKNGDVLVARITPCLENGKAGLVSLLDGDETGFGSTEFIVIRGRATPLSGFACCMSRSDYFRKYAVGNMTGTSGRKRLEAPILAKLPIPIPPDDLLFSFERLCGPKFEMMTQNTKQNQELTQLRDWLLPMLMNGQVTVGA